MVDTKPTSKRTMQAVFADVGERKLVLLGPNNERLQDSRFAILDIGMDHVAIKMLGDGEQLVLPFTAIKSVKVERQLMTIRWG